MARICLISSVHNALDNRIFYREASSLQKFGHSVTLIAIHDKTESIQGIHIIPIRRMHRWQRPFLWIKVMREALHTDADIVHIHDPELLIIATILRHIYKKPVVYDIHESVSDFVEIKDDIPKPIRFFLARVLRWLEPAFANHQSGLIFADDQIAATFEKIRKPKITLYNYPLDSFIQNAQNTKKNLDHASPIILYLGGIKPNRGISLMLDAFSIILRTIPTARLYLVGPFAPESLRSQVQVEIKQRNISQSVKITGAVPFSEIGKYLATASVGWIPFSPVKKYQKNIPTKLFEYMSYAIPVVSSDLESVRQFIESEKNGLLVDPVDPNAHAAAILRILTNDQFHAFLGTNGQKMVTKNYHWSDMESQLINFYSQLLPASIA
jgi:glycosyltransferase involved in cell wall biosynthesis